jgi:hypothetical protein
MDMNWIAAKLIQAAVVAAIGVGVASTVGATSIKTFSSPMAKISQALER